jgi:hypothetical protein
MSFLAKEYEIPFFGKIKFIKATGYDKLFNGDYDYYSEDEKNTTLCKECNSLDNLSQKTIEKIHNYFKASVNISEEKINAEKTRKEKLELILGEISNLKNPLEVEEWLKKYQTKNILQLEYQETKNRILQIFKLEDQEAKKKNGDKK